MPKPAAQPLSVQIKSNAPLEQGALSLPPALRSFFVKPHRMPGQPPEGELGMGFMDSLLQCRRNEPVYFGDFLQNLKGLNRHSADVGKRSCGQEASQRRGEDAAPSRNAQLAPGLLVADPSSTTRRLEQSDGNVDRDDVWARIVEIQHL